MWHNIIQICMEHDPYFSQETKNDKKKQITFKHQIKFHTNLYLLLPKWSACEPGIPVQRPRDQVCRMAIDTLALL